MNRFKQCIYTVILVITCLIASPFIFMQIWQSSAEKKVQEPVKEPSITSQIAADEPKPAPPEESTTAPQQENEETTDGLTPVKPEETTEETTEQAAEPSEGPAAVFVESDPSYFDDALFVGDSRTVGISEYGTLKNADYFCSVGLAAYKVENETIDGRTLHGLLSSKKYGKIYIMLGINEVGNDIEYTIAAYRKMLDDVRALQPDAIIYLEANLHVAKSAQSASITNEGINGLNKRISEFADNETIFYIDINPVFDNDKGDLTQDYTSDGVHVLAKYYQTWCDWFCMNTVPAAEDPEYTSEPEETTAAPVETETETAAEETTTAAE